MNLTLHTGSPSTRILPWTAAVLAIGGALSQLPLGAALLIPAAALATTLLLASPVWGLAFLAIAVPFGGDASIEVGGLRAGPAEAAAGLTLLVMLLTGATRRRIDLRPAGVWIPIGLLLSVFALSAAGAPSLPASLKEAAKWLLFGLSLVLAASLARTPKSRLLLIAAILASSAAEALYGLNQAALGSSPLGFVLGGSMFRAFGHFGQPNPFAAYLSTGLVLAAALVLALGTRPLVAEVAQEPVARGLVPRSPNPTPPGRGPHLVPSHRWPGTLSAYRLPPTAYRLFLIAIAAVLLYAIGSSLSRGAWIGLAAAFAAMISLHHPKGLVVVAGLGAAGASAVALSGAGWLPPVFAARIETLLQTFTIFDPQSVQLTSSNFAVVHRMAIWQAGWEMFMDHPWLGAGPGNFDVAYPLYALPGWPQPPGHAHNFYLNLLAETGVAGLGAYLSLFGYLAVVAVRAVRRVRTSNAAPLTYGCALAGVGLLALLTVYQLFDNLYVHSMNAQAGLILGLALSHHSTRTAALRTAAPQH